MDSIGVNYSGVILGSGFLHKRARRALTRATILAVRGKYTKELVCISEPVQLGDAGLVLPYFLPYRPKKTHLLGIVPHYHDMDDPVIRVWKERFGHTTRIINVLQAPDRVFYEIASCQYIASSSLHGLVVADALNIPNVWLRLSLPDKFKFHDYYSAFDEIRDPLNPTGEESLEDLVSGTRKPSDRVRETMEELYQLFVNLRTYL